MYVFFELLRSINMHNIRHTTDKGKRVYIISIITVCMTNLFCGLEGSTDHNACNHEHVVDLRNIHLTLVLSGSMHNLNSRETT